MDSNFSIHCRSQSLHCSERFANIKSVNEPINSFEEVARRYCQLIETPALTGLEFARECLTLLLYLYEGAMRLPDTDVADLDAPIGHEAWQAVFDSIPARLPGRDYYWLVFSPLESEAPNPVAGSLADDIADIWRDLKPGLLLIDSGGANYRASAIANWRLSFEIHWGRHAVDAIAVLHALCFDVNSRIDPT